MLLSVNVLKRHSFSVTPPDVPEGFVWSLQKPEESKKRIEIKRWNKETEEMYKKGWLKAKERYNFVPTKHPDRYVSTFGIGTAIAALPVYSVLNLFSDISQNRHLWWHGAKTTASLLTALAAIFIFLSMRRFVSPTAAFLGALAFGIGGGAWSILSQALWQQTSFVFFLSLGTYFLFNSGERKNFALYCGAAFGMAVLCRPTGAIIAACAGMYLLFASRPNFVRYALGGLPFAILLGVYNGYYFGSPFVFGQSVAAEALALGKAGGEGVFQTPILEGLTGILFSPSRGMLFYSPVLLIGLAGAVLTWKNPRRFALMIPLQVAALLMFTTQAKWFDWWGGWTYGPRPVVDISVFFALLMIPVIEVGLKKRRIKSLFVSLIVYSAAVQFIGAYSYNVIGWNNKNGMDIDKPAHRSRLWSLRDSQIVHYATNFQKERALKRRLVKQELSKKTPIVSRRPQPR